MGAHPCPLRADELRGAVTTTPTPRDGRGRTQRTIERALELVRGSSDPVVIIVASNRHHCDHLRDRIARLTSVGIPERLRITTPDAVAAASRDVASPVVVLWDHHAHEVHASRLADEEYSLRAKLAEVVETRERHARIRLE